MEASASISTPLGFVPREAIAEFRALGVPFRMDIRPRADGRPVTPPPELPYEAVSCVIEDARRASEPFTLDTAGFTMIDHVSAVQDWRDNDEVIRVFYEECRQVARELTGARHVYTYDHVRREAGVQVYGGGVGEPGEIRDSREGSSYVSFVHLDYTDHSKFKEYLALHGVEEPDGSRVVMLNFWRPIYGVVQRDPLAVCDARTLSYDDLLELTMLGFLPKNYSWHNIGMNLAQLAHSPEQRWYQYSQMTPDEMLIMQTYDSRGVMGRVAPHGAFRLPDTPADAPARCSVELRVLCYID